MKIQLCKLGAVLVSAALMASACGGGGGGSGTANPPPPGPPPPTGGITRTGIAIAVGPITGFGSVIVNGITYDTGNAVFTKDGVAATQDDFAVGQVVLVQGTIDDDNSNAVAQSVVFDDNVEGPVSSVDTATSTIVVLGQTVSIGAGTSIDVDCPETLDGLVAVAAVEVSGSVDADGVIGATRIECKVAAGEFEITGTVSSHDAGTTTFMINALQVNYGSAMLDNFPGGVINDGDLVEAKGTEVDDSGTPTVLTATRVEFKGNRFNGNEGDHIEIEGFITRFVSDEDFDVSSLPVTTIPGTTVFEGGSATDLGLNLKVEVEGEFDVDGVLNATRVEIKTSTAVRVTGLVDSVSADALTILGVTVNTDPTTTRFEDKSNTRLDPLGVGDINMNDYLEVRGQELPVGQITALIVEREDFIFGMNDAELRGFVEVGGVNRPTLTVFGVTIDASAAVFRNENDAPISADTFWAAVAEGRLVDAKGTESGPQSLVADEVELELE